MRGWRGGSGRAGSSSAASSQRPTAPRTRRDGGRWPEKGGGRTAGARSTRPTGGHYRGGGRGRASARAARAPPSPPPDPPAPGDDAALAERWRALRGQLEAFAREQRKPLVLTEVGYLSQRGAAAWPWKEDAQEPVDLDEQRRCYQAFVRAWDGAPADILGGV